jgi:hypothetical protein
MDLSRSHCNFKSHMKSSLHSLIPFLPLLCSCQFRRFNSTTLDYCSTPLLFCFYSYYSCPAEHFLQPFCTDPTENTDFYCQECVFTNPLPSNGCPYILRRVCLCGNVFSESLPSNSYTRHNIFKFHSSADLYNIFQINTRSLGSS